MIAGDAHGGGAETSLLSRNSAPLVPPQQGGEENGIKIHAVCLFTAYTYLDRRWKVGGAAELRRLGTPLLFLILGEARDHFVFIFGVFLVWLGFCKGVR